MTEREIDALIAKKVMGLEDVRTQEQGYHMDLVYGPNLLADVANQVPYYSTNMKDAWTVVEKIISLGYCCTTLCGDYNYTWSCCFIEEKSDHENSSKQYFFESFTAPIAICLAALKAVDMEDEEKE